MTAKNLLYIENSRTILAGTKGTKEYEDIMQKIQEQNYKHQQGKKEGKDGDDKNEKDVLEKDKSEILIDNQLTSKDDSKKVDEKPK